MAVRSAPTDAHDTATKTQWPTYSAWMEAVFRLSLYYHAIECAEPGMDGGALNGCWGGGACSLNGVSLSLSAHSDAAQPRCSWQVMCYCLSEIHCIREQESGRKCFHSLSWGQQRWCEYGWGERESWRQRWWVVGYKLFST